MKKKILLYLASGIIALGFTACGDFLEEYSENQRYAQTAEDLDELLRGECFMEFQTYISTSTQETMSYGANSGIDGKNYPWLHVMDDDAQEYVIGGLPYTENYPRNVLGNFFRWSSDPFLTLNNDAYSDQDWTRFYSHIGALNSIIFKAEELHSTTEESPFLNQIEGEALFLRAGYYFLLANIYGMPYNKLTADKDLSVPLKISEIIEDKYFSRNTVAEVYNQIVDDLQRAAVCLQGVTPQNTLRAGEAAANALLSRVLLYMERYDEAITAADKVLDAPYAVIDLNQLSTDENMISWTSPETIFTQGGNSVLFTFLVPSSDWSSYPPSDQALSFRASDDLLMSFDNEDLRLQHFFRNNATPFKFKSWVSDYSYTDKVGMDFLIRLPEVILNKAEALAMLNRDAEAITTLQMLLPKRFAVAPSIQASGTSLIDYIRAERRRELCFEGHRWFDLRRYAVNSIHPLPDDFVIRHTVHELDATSKVWNETGYYQLNSFAKDYAAWMIPIPNYAIEFNKGSLTNEVRPNRELLK